MNSQFLESLVALSQHGSIADAARAQGLTPTAVSQRLKALEALMGIALTIRSGKTVSLTEAGIRILPHAKQVLSEQRNLMEVVNQDSISGRLELGVISTAMTGLIPRALKSLGKSSHDIEIKLHPGTSAFLYDRLIADELDAIVISHPPFSVPKSLRIEAIHHEELCLIFAKDFLPASSLIKSQLAHGVLINELHDRMREHPFIRYDHKSWGGTLVTAYLKDQRLRVEEFCELDALEAIFVLVDSGLGMALVPNWPAPWAEGLCLEKIIIPNPAYARRVVLLRKGTSGKETTIHYMGKLLCRSINAD